MKAALLVCFLLPLYPFNAFNQITKGVAASTPPKDGALASSNLSTTLARYSSESFVIERHDSIYKMAADGTGSHQIAVTLRVQSEASLRQLGVLILPFAGSTEHVEIAFARVRRPDGTLIETPVSGAIEMPDPVTREAPFYSDLKQMQLPIRSLGVGDTLEWQATIVRTKAEAPGYFWGQESFVEDAVALSQSLELRVPKNSYVNVWSPTNKATETVVGDERVFRWVASQMKPTVGKEAEAEKELKKKQTWTSEQELESTEGKLPSVAWTTFKSWEAVGAWYRALEEDRMLPDAEVKAKVAELSKGKSTQEEKVRAVYTYVATQIRYIGVAFGVGRYQPHTASEVLQNQYGDCKDKHTLLAAMLGALDLHANAVLAGAGVRFNEAVPSPASFNHLITQVLVDGQVVWLDATAEVIPYRALMFSIRDKRALVIPEVGVARIERTPAALPFSSFQTMDATGSLDKDGTSNSRLVLTLRGDAEFALRSALRVTPPAQYDLVVQRLSQGIGYAGTVSHVDISSLSDPTQPLQISYDYKREKAGDWDHHRIIPQLMPVFLPRTREDNPPIRTLSLGLPRVETATSAIKLPAGWIADVPEAVHAKSAYATYDQTYKFENGTLYSQRRIEVLKEKVPAPDWENYKKWADTADLGNERFVQLTQATEKLGTPSTNEPAAKPRPAEEAGRLVISANQAMERHDFVAAKYLLDQAKMINQEQPRLWLVNGSVAALQGDMQTAISDYKKELSLHPDQYEAYRRMALAQVILEQRTEAKESLRNWAAIDASNPLPTVLLINLMLQDGDAAMAVGIAEAAIVRLPEDHKKNEALQIQLGRAQLLAGMKEEGRATLLAVLATTQSAEMMNDAAYALADAGVELARAESSTRTALAKMDEESKPWTLEEKPQLMLNKSLLTIATWDTMGWILYKQGRLEEAEVWLKAAWLHGQRANVAEHLGEVEAAGGKKDAALTTYEIALAAIPAYDSYGIQKKQPGTEEKKLKERADALRKAGAKLTVDDPQKGLQDLRRISVFAAHDLKGTAEYRLLFADNKVENAKATGSEDVKGGAARIKNLPLPGFWPTGSNAKLIRTGTLICSTANCRLLLEP